MNQAGDTFTVAPEELALSAGQHPVPGSQVSPGATAESCEERAKEGGANGEDIRGSTERVYHPWLSRGVKAACCLRHDLFNDGG